jgi:hypothetical protein
MPTAPAPSLESAEAAARERARIAYVQAITQEAQQPGTTDPGQLLELAQALGRADRWTPFEEAARRGLLAARIQHDVLTVRRVLHARASRQQLPALREAAAKAEATLEALREKQAREAQPVEAAAARAGAALREAVTASDPEAVKAEMRGGGAHLLAAPGVLWGEDVGLSHEALGSPQPRPVPPVLSDGRQADAWIYPRTPAPAAVPVLPAPEPRRRR